MPYYQVIRNDTVVATVAAASMGAALRKYCAANRLPVSAMLNLNIHVSLAPTKPNQTKGIQPC